LSTWGSCKKKQLTKLQQKKHNKKKKREKEENKARKATESMIATQQVVQRITNWRGKAQFDAIWTSAAIKNAKDTFHKKFQTG